MLRGGARDRHGFEVPAFLGPRIGRMVLDDRGRFRLGTDFPAQWDGPPGSRIFALNAGLHSHGIAEPQLSPMAWRSAVIVNALTGRAQFDINMRAAPVTWSSREEALQSVEL